MTVLMLAGLEGPLPVISTSDSFSSLSGADFGSVGRFLFISFLPHDISKIIIFDTYDIDLYRFAFII